MEASWQWTQNPNLEEVREKLRIKLSKLKAIAITWMSMAIIFAVIEHFTLSSDYSQGPASHYSFVQNLLFHLGATIIAIGVGATVLVFVIHERFRERPYWWGISVVVGWYITVVSIITLIMGLVLTPMNTGLSFNDAGFGAAYRAYLLDTVHLKNIIFWSVVVGFTQLLLQINDKFGHGVLWSLIKGRYHRAREEERIFMFLDLKSSTTTAEKLGNQLYHNFLRDYFSDITNAILYNKGQIYQYVGDEAVITWRKEEGISDYHCLKCYFDIKSSIEKRRAKYEDRYGFIPEFKAGLHTGKVIAGEVGIIKRDITYSGDVLNTAARIQSKCNEFGVPILASKALMDLFPADLPFARKPIGEIELRGKSLKVPLSTFSMK